MVRLSQRSLGLLGLLSSLVCMDAVKAESVNDRLSNLNQSMQLCISAASRPGFPYYDRTEAKQRCQQSKELLHKFKQEANYNRSLGCASRIAVLDFDLWKIQFLGGKRMQSEVDDAFSQLQKNCFNMDTR